jgi:glycosyltransferase involved in cell wall biosynthesis
MDVRKKKIMFVLPSLDGGGAERVMLTLIEHIDREKFEPIFVLTKKEGRYVHVLDTLPPMEVIDLDAPQARYAIKKLAKLIWKKKPDIVFSTLGYLNLLIALIRPFFSNKIKFISRESNTVSIENKQEKYPKLFDWLYKKVYNNFNLIITQSRYMRDDLVNNFKTKNEKIVVIYNPVNIEDITKKSQVIRSGIYPKQKINLLAVGRLSAQKGFDVLIEAMSYLDDRFHLTILGEGDDEAIHREWVKELGCQEKITMQGFVDNPYVYMKNADLFVLSSRYEGLPNVVLESNVCGTPCVAFNTPGGTAEVIEDGKTGLLVEEFSASALAKAIEQASALEFDKRYIKEYIQKQFNVKKIVREYERNFLNGVG